MVGMNTSAFLEVEAKFAVSENLTVPPLDAVVGVATVAEPVTHHLSAVYYDTEDLRLLRNKVSLRRRTGGKDSGWHVKLKTEGGRLELTAPLDDVDENGSVQVPESLLSMVRSIVRDHELVPVAQVDNTRYERELLNDDGVAVAEFCDDNVTGFSLLPGGTSTKWREWEVELTGALDAEDGDKLINSAMRYFVSHGAHLSSSPAKLVSALGASVDKAPKPPMPADLPEGSPGNAVVTALQANHDRLIALDPTVRRDEWDSVHQMRVTTRELRSHLQTFDGILVGDQFEFVEKGLKKLAGILGVARDAEVVEERILELIDEVDPAIIDAHAREKLTGQMAREYKEAHAASIEYMNSEEYFRLLDSLDELLADPPLAGGELDVSDADDADAADAAADEAGVSTEAVLAEHLDKAYDKLMKRHQKAIDGQDDESLSLHEREDNFHDVRKGAKRLRYSAEAAGKTTGLKTKKLYNACKDLQSSLGDFQDAVTARDVLLEKSKQAEAEGQSTFAYGVLYQMEHQYGLEALQKYNDDMAAIVKAYKRLKGQKKK